MPTGYQPALAELAADTIAINVTPADITQATKAAQATKLAQAKTAHAAHLANVAKAKAIQAASAAQAANVANAQAANAQAANAAAAKGFSYHAKAAVLSTPFYFSLASGIIIGIAASHLVKKLWPSKKKDTAE